MSITYTEERNFTPQQAADLFLSVRWVVGKYPDRLHKALMNSSRVRTVPLSPEHSRIAASKPCLLHTLRHWWR